MDEILPKLLGADQIRSYLEILGPLTNAGEIRFLGPRRNGQEFEIIGEGF